MNAPYDPVDGRPEPHYREVEKPPSPSLMPEGVWEGIPGTKPSAEYMSNCDAMHYVLVAAEKQWEGMPEGDAKQQLRRALNKANEYYLREMAG